MNKVITYSLENRFGKTDDYYSDIEFFSDEVLNKLKTSLKAEVRELIDFIKCNKIEDIRYEEEYLIDFLIIGIIYKMYIKKAVNVEKNKVKLIRKNIENINKSGITKKVGKFIKGKLSTLYLSKSLDKDIDLNLNSKETVINYLELTDEFTEEVKRMHNIYLFIKDKYTRDTDIYIVELARKLMYITDYFEEASKVKLGKYTRRVNYFLENEHKNHKYKEDIIYTGKLEVEYHLNMVVSSIINKIFYNEFRKSNEKIL